MTSWTFEGWKNVLLNLLVAYYINFLLSLCLEEGLSGIWFCSVKILFYLFRLVLKPEFLALIYSYPIGFFKFC